VTYSINRRQSDRDRHFDIDSQTGLLTLAKKLDFERQNVHEIVIVARDGGEVPQETSAFITVRVSGIGETQNVGGESGESSVEYTESPVVPSVSVPALGSNEFAPKFESRSYSVEVLESAEPGSSVLKLTAVDKDQGENGHVIYSLRFDDNGESKHCTDCKFGNSS
jgi:protocadherin-16/23